VYQKLFQITIVFFLVIVSIVTAAMIVTALVNVFASPMLAQGHGIVFVVGAVSARQFLFMIVAASLLIAGFYLFFRRRRFRR
jgi:hypothetical protein